MEYEISRNITFITAFFAGIISFLSPCVLPLIPGYISFISGVSIQELTDNSELKKVREKVLINSLFFVIGFSFVFISFGASATAIGQLLIKHTKVFSIIAGIIIIIFGLHLTGILKIKALYKEKRFHVMQKPLNVWGSFIIGLAFAFGWTPCLGPIIGSIIAIASVQETVLKGILLLTFYSLGLAIPFMITAYSVTLFFKMFDKIKKHLNIIEWTAGLLLIILGILILTGKIYMAAGWFGIFDGFML